MHVKQYVRISVYLIEIEHTPCFFPPMCGLDSGRFKEAFTRFGRVIDLFKCLHHVPSDIDEIVSLDFFNDLLVREHSQ